MEFKNNKIIEALCAIRFTPSDKEWDMSYLLDYYQKVKDSGFIHKQEIRPFRVDFNITNPEKADPPVYSYDDVQMSFNNPTENYSIIVAKNYLSFHCLKSYPGWEIFLPETAKYLDKYRELGLNESVASVQLLYINDFEIEDDLFKIYAKIEKNNSIFTIDIFVKAKEFNISLYEKVIKE